MKCSPLVVTSTLFIFVGSAHAATTVYTSRAAYLAAAPPT
jgi:hypothetical protein